MRLGPQLRAVPAGPRFSIMPVYRAANIVEGRFQTILTDTDGTEFSIRYDYSFNPEPTARPAAANPEHLRQHPVATASGDQLTVVLGSCRWGDGEPWPASPQAQG